MSHEIASHSPETEKEAISNFKELLDKEAGSFNHPRPEIFQLSRGTTPEWVKYVAAVVGGGDERVALTCPPDVEMGDVFLGNELIQYKKALITNAGEIIWGQEEIGMWANKPAEIKKIVYVAE